MEFNKLIKKNERSIIINDSNNEIDTKLMITNLSIYKVSAGHVYNPPFFNNIIVLKKRYSEDDLKLLWNMTLVNGQIIFYNNKNQQILNFYKSRINLKNKNYIIINKTENTIYQFPKYRVLDFIIAGTMKGGTTAAITNFNKHPKLFVIKEEIHYFDKKENYQKGLEWYKSHFNYNKQLVGDKAPDVMYQTSCLELLQITNPNVKIILFLRNPMERCYSHWKMTKERFRNQRSFEDCINDELNNRMGENRFYDVSFWYHFIQRGFYFEQIEEILKYFPKDNLLILISEKVKNNMNEEYQKVFEFLNIEYHEDNYVEEFSSNNPDDILEKKSILYKKLKKIYLKDIKKLEKFLGYKTEWL